MQLRENSFLDKFSLFLVSSNMNTIIWMITAILCGPNWPYCYSAKDECLDVMILRQHIEWKQFPEAQSLRNVFLLAVLLVFLQNENEMDVDFVMYKKSKRYVVHLKLMQYHVNYLSIQKIKINKTSQLARQSLT